MPKSIDVIAVYEALAERAGVELKGAKMRYTSAAGNMFSFITAEGDLAVRLSAEDRDRFLAEHPTAECVQHGRVMKDYVVVPNGILADKRKLNRLFDKSVANAATLKPKPTTKKKAKKGVKKKATKKKAATKKAAKQAAKKKRR